MSCQGDCLTIPPDLKREGCCADVRKPCTFHEGYSDGWDAHARSLGVDGLPVRQVSPWGTLEHGVAGATYAADDDPRYPIGVVPRDDGSSEPEGFIDLETGAFLDGAMGRGILA